MISITEKCDRCGAEFHTDRHTRSYDTAHAGISLGDGNPLTLDLCGKCQVGLADWLRNHTGEPADEPRAAALPAEIPDADAGDDDARALEQYPNCPASLERQERAAAEKYADVRNALRRAFAGKMTATIPEFFAAVQAAAIPVSVVAAAAMLDAKPLYNAKSGLCLPPYVAQALAQYFGVTVVKPDPEAEK